MKKTFLLSTFMQLPTYHMQSRAALHTRRFNSNFAIFPNSTALAKRQDQTNSGLNKKAKRTLKIALGLCFFMILSVNVLIVKQQICFSSLNLQQVIINHTVVVLSLWSENTCSNQSCFGHVCIVQVANHKSLHIKVRHSYTCSQLSKQTND